MPIVRMRLTPAAAASATSSASGAGPWSRWVWESITPGLSRLDLREQRRDALHRLAPGRGAVARALDRRLLPAQRREQPGGGVGDVGGEQDGDHAQALG